jgi:hypothetical protein
MNGSCAIVRRPGVLGRLPKLIAASQPTSRLQDMAATYGDQLKADLIDNGCILMRGFAVRNMQCFDEFLEIMGFARMPYIYGSSPRMEIESRIFTASEFPADRQIPLHNENAYQRRWPSKLAFCCLVPATTGGETTVADMRNVTEKIGADILAEFAERKVEYVRHYYDFIDVPWRQVFGTQDVAEVGRICGEMGIEFQWLAPDVLRTSQVCQGVATHPQRGDLLYFNQAHLFHVSSVGPIAASIVMRTFGADRLPRHARFGDGTDIDDRKLEQVRQSFESETQLVRWQSGDVLLVDNMQFAHGRLPFKGSRSLAVSLLDPAGG